MASLMLEAEPRQGFGKGPNRQLRRTGRIPAVVYGAGKDTIPLSVDPKAVVSVIRSHGGVNTIFELSIKGAKGTDNVMIKDYQLEPVEHDLLHADFHRIAMDKEMTLFVAVELVGVSTGVKNAGGTLDFITRSVEISCFPKDIPETITVEVSELDIGDYVRASELELPEGVNLLSSGSVVVAHVLAPKVEEEETPEEGEEGVEADAEGDAAKAETSEEGPAKE